MAEAGASADVIDGQRGGVDMLAESLQLALLLESEDDDQSINWADHSLPQEHSSPPSPVGRPSPNPSPTSDCTFTSERDSKPFSLPTSPPARIRHVVVDLGDLPAIIPEHHFPAHSYSGAPFTDTIAQRRYAASRLAEEDDCPPRYAAIVPGVLTMKTPYWYEAASLARGGSNTFVYKLRKCGIRSDWPLFVKEVTAPPVCEAYVVMCGRGPGVYTDWDDVVEATHRFSCAIFKGYPTLDAAEDVFDQIDARDALYHYPLNHYRTVVSDDWTPGHNRNYLLIPPSYLHPGVSLVDAGCVVVFRGLQVGVLDCADFVVQVKGAVYNCFLTKEEGLRVYEKAITERQVHQFSYVKLVPPSPPPEHQF
ncbi:hypothetical protein CERSUDRAFT_92358 [Gelatoporia subvermispora B]|uniref:Ribonuclease H1 N-terminal domain-containing protein n=1 Tax=Ceriporiopsis subvermispora (strain B) TaxID=914234 RepID=M2RN19_CERS8|nr:hypothetical protein CERSUDRAFT_92358 [Gelatoporia subvermispora B]